MAELRKIETGPGLVFDVLVDGAADAHGWHTLLGLLGQFPYAWPAPNGYPDTNGKWLSAGAMVYTAPYATDAVSLIRAADDALYRAKAAGRNRVELVARAI